MQGFILKNIVYIAWVQALIATLGSLFFSEIWNFKPCILCWYQRILMYPLVILLTVGIVRKDKNLPYYILPLSVLGALVASYHLLLFYGLLPESIAPCELGASCKTKYLGWFGFITIPLLSLVAFLVISVSMEISRRLNSK